MGRSSLLEVIREDYVRTARAKGLNNRWVIALHALPNALLPVITLSGVLLGLVLAGSIPVERAFGTPGLGYSMFQAVSERDVFVMQNLVFIYSVVFVMLNIVVDVRSRSSIPGFACDDHDRHLRRRTRPALAPAHDRTQHPHPGPPRAALGLLGRHRCPDRHHGDRRAGDRALSAAQVGLPRHAEAAERGALVRHRPDRPRYAEPRHVRRAELAHRGAGRGAVRHDRGRPVGPGLRLFRWTLRHGESACHRVPAILSRPDPGHGHRHGAGRRHADR
jgi:hypothetical protein